MVEAPRLRVVEAALFERPVSMRLPFRFGAATVTDARQAFLRLVVEDASGRRAPGAAAELMVPKWFDKNPALSNADNEAQLRRSLELAIELARDAGLDTAFARHAAIEPRQHARAAAEGLNGLIASFGLALVDRAVLDALCRMHDAPIVEAVRANLPGLTAATAPDLAGFDIEAFLAALRPSPTLHLRHTVGYADALRAADLASRRDDGLPETLEEEIAAYGLTHFKIKLAGRPADDAERLRAIAPVLDSLPHYRVTLDGNEQFENEAHVLEFWELLRDRLANDPKLGRLRACTLFVEQPINRATALSQSVAKIAAQVPIEIDESDGAMGAFVQAKRQGYAGVSSKSCKGFYRSLLNAMRVERWTEAGEGRFFMSAEDLTTQAGIAVQQDLALAALLGLGHVERNGHHYVDGMAGASREENRAFLGRHPDLYREAGGRTRLRVDDGRLALGTVLAAPGLGVAPDAADAVFRSLEEERIAA